MATGDLAAAASGAGARFDLTAGAICTCPSGTTAGGTPPHGPNGPQSGAPALLPTGAHDGSTGTTTRCDGAQGADHPPGAEDRGGELPAETVKQAAIRVGFLSTGSQGSRGA